MHERKSNKNVIKKRKIKYIYVLANNKNMMYNIHISALKSRKEEQI